MANSKAFVADLASSVSHVPAKYIRPTSDRPNLSEFWSTLDDSSIPVIDLQDLRGPSRPIVIKEIGQACKDYGFFQVKNHGVSSTVIDAMFRVSREFFQLPESERLKIHSNDPMKEVRLASSFNVNTEHVSNWRDYLRLFCHPLEDYIHQWPSNPPSFREAAAEYCRNARELALTLLDAISESLGLERDYINTVLGKHGQHMAVNYYPPCPQPELTYGLTGHTDPNAITLLLQDDVPGLQVLNNDKWLPVKPIPYAFFVNIGDQIQVISNDRYKSVRHRALVNSEKERISIPTFYCPSADAVIGPAPPLTDDDIDNHHPAFYRRFAYSEFYRKFWSRGLAEENCLDMFKIK
ncbi:hypothetical protein K2173_004854 [Erythroxylum novogranatense]|uniref:Fe2OG dioxygenase domain-containing protein n=1 Tax=Erythroxylum novogranatense TaxID=1862640 RepID=A0AAV8U8G3_9ROSI|nr:hypothetical protein K2173_004854 [Erythroxylum novogranatense]